MKDLDYVMYMLYLEDLEKKKKEASKNKTIDQNLTSNVQNDGKNDQEGFYEKNKQHEKAINGKCESNSILGKSSSANNSNRTSREPILDNKLKHPIEDGKDNADYHVKQGISENNTMLSSNVIDLCESPNKDKEESCKEVIQDEKLEEPINESKTSNKEQDGSSDEEENPDQQRHKYINGECELNIVTSDDTSLDNVKSSLNNISGSQLLIKDEKDQKYHVTQGIPRSIKFRAITNFYKCTKRLSSLEDEYNWDRILEERRSEQNEGKREKDQDNSPDKALPMQKENDIINGDSLTNKSNCTLKNKNADKKTKNSKKLKKNQDSHENHGISSNSTEFDSLINLCEVIENETLEEHDENKREKDQEDSFEGEPLDQQQEDDINDQIEINTVTGKDNIPLAGSQLLVKDEKDKKYRLTRGIPESVTFRSTIDLYKCTKSLSAVEDEYNWNIRSTGENSNMNISTKRESNIISTDKKNVGSKRKRTENQKGKGGKDATTSSTSKIAKN